MKALAALAGGLAGACAVTALNEAARRVVPRAPRLDVLGTRGVEKVAEAAGVEPPRGGRLLATALAGDLVANTLYYGLVGLGGRDGALLRGAALGLAAGVGAVTLPGPLGLGEAPTGRAPATKLMTVGWYLVGGLAAAAAFRLLAGPKPPARA